MKLKPITGEWLDDCRKNGWTADTVYAPDNWSWPEPRELYEQMKQKILTLGGDAVCLHREEDVDRILSRGRSFTGKPLMMEGEPCHCHSNSAALWEANRDQVRIATGYGLSPDSMWRQHSWCVRVRDHRVVETTIPRLIYFGFIMDEQECELFAFDNLY